MFLSRGGHSVHDHRSKIVSALGAGKAHTAGAAEHALATLGEIVLEHQIFDSIAAHRTEGVAVAGQALQKRAARKDQARLVRPGGSAERNFYTVQRGGLQRELLAVVHNTSGCANAGQAVW